MSLNQDPTKEPAKFAHEVVRKAIHGHGNLKQLPSEVFSELPIITSHLFVERKEEIERLGRGVAYCIQGIYDRIIVFGDRGIGKTSLLNLFESNDFSNEYVSINLDKSIFEEGIEHTLLEISSQLLEVILREKYVGNRDETDKSRRLLEKIEKIQEEIADEKIKTTSAAATRLRDAGLQLDNLPLVNSLLEKINLNHKKKIIYFIDDLDKLTESKEVYGYFLKQRDENKKFLIPIVFACPIEFLEMMQKENDELLKNSYLIEVKPLTIEGCKQLLRSRIMLFENELGIFKDSIINKIKDHPNYSSDLDPFEETAVEQIATVANGSPLKFIRLAKEAYTEALSSNKEAVTLQLVLMMLNKNPSQNTHQSIILTKKQKNILDYILTSGPTTYKELANNFSFSKVNALIQLKNIEEKGYIVRSKRGREVIFTVKQI